ncbi:MAG TPA: crosslink repair DNA glycosylase YcaQ family protein [Candidatus Binatia bacterium]|nr:crosslink repair DNA glycosylase YcaQ family protein [Candidatus Binatia bacterium]
MFPAVARAIAVPEARETLSREQARRIAIAAQGLLEPRPAGRVDRRHLRRLFDRVHAVQMDSVNVFARAHEIALHARLGAHARDLASAMARDREVFEYWGHEASLMPSRLQPLLRWRMRRAREAKTMWPGLRRFAQEQARYVERVLDEVRERGPLSARELLEPGDRLGAWWGWSAGKRALEVLFWRGDVCARRRPSFEREYDVPERVLPSEVFAAPTPDERDAKRALVELSARALGVATARELADYFRLDAASAQTAVSELVDEGVLQPVRIEGAKSIDYLHREARVPRNASARAILSPFDSLVWHRSRTERLFDVHFRLELYTPPARRTFGYYVVLLLLGDRLVARIDLGASRDERTLLVKRVGIEEDCGESAVLEPLVEELAALGRWLDLRPVVLDPSRFGRRVAAALRMRELAVR